MDNIASRKRGQRGDSHSLGSSRLPCQLEISAKNRLASDQDRDFFGSSARPFVIAPSTFGLDLHHFRLDGHNLTRLGQHRLGTNKGQLAAANLFLSLFCQQCFAHLVSNFLSKKLD